MSAPFRIERPAQLKGVRGGNEEFKDYLGRLLKMIPAEVVGVYMIGNGFIPVNVHIASAVWAAICLVLVIVVRLYGTADPDRSQGPQPVPVFIAAVAFVIWIYNMGGPFALYGLYQGYIGSLAVLLWTFIVPIFYKGE